MLSNAEPAVSHCAVPSQHDEGTERGQAGKDPHCLHGMHLQTHLVDVFSSNSGVTAFTAQDMLACIHFAALYWCPSRYSSAAVRKLLSWNYTSLVVRLLKTGGVLLQDHIDRYCHLIVFSAYLGSQKREGQEGFQPFLDSLPEIRSVLERLLWAFPLLTLELDAESGQEKHLEGERTLTV